MKHLGYCTNIHPGESWSEVRDNLRDHVLAVKARVSPNARFGVGLRLSARAAQELRQRKQLDDLVQFLAENDLYVFTINGCPYGSFHGGRIKEDVYRPDWLEDPRLDYSDLLADLLAGMLPADVDMGTVSTVPGAFKPRAASFEDREDIAERLIAHAAKLCMLEDQTGKRITLALEPEPCCLLETVSESIAFFHAHLFTSARVAHFGNACGRSRGDAEEALRRHLGICFDACHMAVEFESMEAALDAYARAGICVPKAQISAGLELPAEASLEALARFDEPVYLHQVVEERDHTLIRYVDLGEAIEASRERRGRWRVHFHVPLFHETFEGELASTRPETAELLHLLGDDHRDTTHLEVETYTWDVLPEEYRALDIDDAIARELTWTRSELDQS